MSSWRQRFQADAAALQAAGLLRRRRVVLPLTASAFEVDGQAVTAFASNDYLGLSRHPRLNQHRSSPGYAGVGAPVKARKQHGGSPCRGKP